MIIDLGCKPRRERRWCLAEWSKRSHRIIQRSVLYIANAHVGLSQSPRGRQRCQLLCIGLKRRCHLSFRQIPIKWSWQSFPLPSSNSNAEKEGQFEVSIFEEEGATILCSLLHQTIPRLPPHDQQKKLRLALFCRTHDASQAHGQQHHRNYQPPRKRQRKQTLSCPKPPGSVPPESVPRQKKKSW